MASLSKVILIGNLGSDPEMRYTPDGKPVTSFRMATNRRYTTSGGESRLSSVINTYPRDGKFTSREDYTLATGKGRMGRCVLALR